MCIHALPYGIFVLLLCYYGLYIHALPVPYGIFVMMLCIVIVALSELTMQTIAF